MKPPLPALGVALLACLSAPGPLGAQLECDACHGELELLRQHVPSLDEARRLSVSLDDIRASAHSGSSCADCHAGYVRFPHEGARTTATCASCHEDADAAWADGIHGRDGNADCSSCHGVHSVQPVTDLRERAGAREMRRSCAQCHFEPRIPADDPHADSVSCSGCHEPHRTLPPSDPSSAVHAANQAGTCGACHEDVREHAARDTHGEAIRHLLAAPETEPGAPEAGPPSCSACHGAHGMALNGEGDGVVGIAERCAGCHERYAESFADSYHGQASELGSPAVATCDDCHAPHRIYPASDARSSVSPERVLDTCRQCHPAATAGFARFQPHADHADREKYPYVYWSYRLMTGLLVAVFVFFGLHSLLWLGRSGLERLAPAGDKDVTP